MKIERNIDSEEKGSRPRLYTPANCRLFRSLTKNGGLTIRLRGYSGVDSIGNKRDNRRFAEYFFVRLRKVRMRLE
jgi:hypothetical protein